MLALRFLFSHCIFFIFCSLSSFLLTIAPFLCWYSACILHSWKPGFAHECSGSATHPSLTTLTHTPKFLSFQTYYLSHNGILTPICSFVIMSEESRNVKSETSLVQCKEFKQENNVMSSFGNSMFIKTCGYMISHFPSFFSGKCWLCFFVCFWFSLWG